MHSGKTPNKIFECISEKVKSESDGQRKDFMSTQVPGSEENDGLQNRLQGPDRKREGGRGHKVEQRHKINFPQ